MKKQTTILYLQFILAFLLLHLCGLLFREIPYLLQAILVFTVVFTVLLLLRKMYPGAPLKITAAAIGFRKTTFRHVLPGILVSAGLLGMYPLISLLGKITIQTTADWYLNLAGLLLTGGLAEEILFRGFLFGELRKQMRFKKAVFRSALVFTGAHLLLFTYFPWPLALFSTILAAGLSLPFAYLFEQGQNSVWAPALVHATIRTVGMVFTTGEAGLPLLSSWWILLSLFVPWIILSFYPSFRKLIYTKQH